MTREEAKRIATGLRTDFKCESDTMVDFCNTVIKALDQESILDKIRAEIADYQKEAIYSDDIVMTKRMVLAIIDKYKIESVNL